MAFTLTRYNAKPSGIALEVEDFKAFWNGRPRMKPLHYIGRAYHSFGQTAITIARIDRLRAKGRLEHAR